MNASATDLHRVSPDFRTYLESDVIRAFRRNRRHARMRMLALVIASLGIGLSAGLAPAQIIESARRDALLVVAQADLALAAMRLELARTTHADVTAKWNVGAADQGALAAATAELRAMEARAARAQLNIAEIKATAQPPRDDIGAPVVNGKDYVSERLTLDLFVADQELRAAQQSAEEIRRRVRIGATNELAAKEAQLHVARATATLGRIAEQRKARQEFLTRGASVDELMARLQLQLLRLDAQFAQTAVELARERMTLIEKQQAVGAASDVDRLRAELNVKERELELAAIARQLRAVNLMLARP